METRAARTPTNDIAPFWLEPWRYAAPAWRERYGAPRCDVDAHAARLVYGGWAAYFGLAQGWRPPSDPNWLAVLRAPPASLHRLASALGYIALVRAGASNVLLHAAWSDRACACALKYRETNCMKAVLLTSPPFDPAACRARPTPHDCGVDVLRAMARQAWPEAESRFAMLVSPPSPNVPDGLKQPGCPVQSEPGPALRIERVDVRRTLSVCAAVMRRLGADSVVGGEQ